MAKGWNYKWQSEIVKKKCYTCSSWRILFFSWYKWGGVHEILGIKMSGNSWETDGKKPKI